MSLSFQSVHWILGVVDRVWDWVGRGNAVDIIISAPKETHPKKSFSAKGFQVLPESVVANGFRPVLSDYRPSGV